MAPPDELWHRAVLLFPVHVGVAEPAAPDDFILNRARSHTGDDVPPGGIVGHETAWTAGSALPYARRQSLEEVP
ncbi:hypothetical protein BE11_01195 [Sorangium cellulosum]|nr:hypothetical protein BE11_01195 [Sorangium cellulosum]